MLSARLLQFLPHTQTRVSVHTHRAEISIAARFTGQFKRVGPEQGTYFMSPFWHLNYQMAPRFFLETFWTLLLNDTYKSSSYLTDNAIHFYYQVQPGTLPASYKTWVTSLQYLSTWSHKRHDFMKDVTEHKMCFDFSVTLAWNIIKRIRRDTVINANKPSREIPVVFVGLNQTWFFSTDFRKILKYQI
jgi:hypothetical protein